MTSSTYNEKNQIKGGESSRREHGCYNCGNKNHFIGEFLKPKMTNHLLEELRVIVKMGMNREGKQHVSWQHPLKEVSLNVTLDESLPKPRTSPLVDDDVIQEHAIQNHDGTQNPNCDLEEAIHRVENIKEIRDHPIDQVIGELDERTLRSHAQDRSNFFAFVSTIKPKNIKEAIKDESWTMAMQEELDQFTLFDVINYLCTLVSTFNFVYDNAEMEDNMDVDKEDRKYCLGDMSIGFEEDTSNGEIKVTLYQEDHKALCNKMDVAVNLDQFIADVMHTENMYVAIESHSFESYQIMNLSEENPMKVNDTTSLKTGFCVVRRK
ncbi:hypothetical protein Tco_0934611 [Tanacetum coccineum]